MEFLLKGNPGENEESNGTTKVHVDREIFDQTKLDQYYEFQESKQPTGCLEIVGKQASKNCFCSGSSVITKLRNFFPILEWLSNYSWKKDLVYDMLSGSTVAIMHIPQGLGYGLLGGVAPIVGIYMAFFPVLIYAILGTSHHISLGTFAVTTLMTARVVDRYGSTGNVTESMDLNITTSEANANLTNLEVATAVCLMVGLWQMLMGILRLGVLGLVLSDHLVSGFTTAAACHVLTSQIKNLFGIPVPRYSGPFRLIRSYKDIFSSLGQAEIPEMITSAVTVGLLVFHNEFLKPRYEKKLKFPVPIELLTLVLGTLISYFSQLKERYGIEIIDEIPTGLPEPSLPPFWLLPHIMVDTLIIAVVAYAVSLSMAKILATKQGYRIRSNQELLAQGAANTFGSFFSCMPSTASLSRSLLQESVGGKTQLASIVSCTLLLAVILWIGPFFETLPLAILSSVIVVALKGMFMQVKDFFKAIKCSPLDAVIWIITFLGVIIIDIDIGLGLGVVASIAVLLYRGQRPYAAVLANLPGTELFVDVEKYPLCVEEPGIKVIRWTGGLHFANSSVFWKFANNVLEMDGTKTEKEAQKLMLDSKSLKSFTAGENSNNILNETRSVVLDCSALAFVDLAGSNALLSLYNSLIEKGISLCLAGCSTIILEQLQRVGFPERVAENTFFPTVLDAVLTKKASVE